ncbi:hypothetical protein [Heyndrickxia ginsengihumi]|uniref:hypothetical protein n=1 Tax=Heyndrickxia ginsengihumi TaxID=363870 RepID=UPI0020402448|nr:hypothetical protein [Heyndrickxia ginsengihumi]MCM3024988.1 hypothetical protein [Heyndrickxia ginsengihumi]
MSAIDENVMKYNQIKVDLLKIAQCIDCCTDNEKELYQDIAMEYSKELRRIKSSIEEIYGIKLYGCCSFP